MKIQIKTALLALILFNSIAFTAAAEDSTLDVAVPIQLMPFVQGFGINGANPTVYLPSGLAAGGHLWFFGTTSDSLAMPYNQNTISGYQAGAKAGYSIKLLDYADKPKFAIGGMLGKPLMVLGHRVTSISAFAGFEYMSSKEVLYDYPENLLEGTENAARPFIEFEFKNTYVLMPVWLHALQLLYWNFSDVTASLRLFYNMPVKSYTILSPSMYSFIMTDPYSTDKLPAIAGFEEYYSGNSGSIDASIYIKYLFFTLSFEHALSNRMVVNMSMNFTFNFANEDKRDFEISGQE